MVTQGVACLGPVTQAGCDALCPSYNRACFGCFGPMETPNTTALSEQFARNDLSQTAIMHAFRGFNAYAEPFRKESEAHEK
jgi:coenzyme F420-reducing hydrogenase gamma subunit